MSPPRDSTLACTVNRVPEMIISGGKAGDGLDSTAVTSDGENFDDLPRMPLRFINHCIVALDGNDLFVTGGYTPNGPTDTTFNNQSFLYHYDTMEWERLEDMPTPRTDHMCAMVHNEEGDEEVIVVGGYGTEEIDGTDQYNVVEIYNIQSGKWRTGQLKGQYGSFVFFVTSV